MVDWNHLTNVLEKSLLWLVSPLACLLACSGLSAHVISGSDLRDKREKPGDPDDVTELRKITRPIRSEEQLFIRTCHLESTVRKLSVTDQATQIAYFQLHLAITWLLDILHESSQRTHFVSSSAATAPFLRIFSNNQPVCVAAAGFCYKRQVAEKLSHRFTCLPIRSILPYRTMKLQTAVSSKDLSTLKEMAELDKYQEIKEANSTNQKNMETEEKDQLMEKEESQKMEVIEKLK